METIADAVAANAPEAAVKTLLARAKSVQAVELMREVIGPCASTVDIDRPPVPAHLHPYQTLAAAAGLSPFLKRDTIFPLAQAVWYIAKAPKREAHQEFESRVVGEEIHLSNSLVVAIRAGNVREATSLFNGLLSERKERGMVGDMFLQAAGEDTVHIGHKLNVAALGWILARQVGWKGSPLTLWPAIHYVASAPKDSAPFQRTALALGRARIDLAASRKNTGQVSGDVAALREGLVSGDADAAVEGAITALRSGTAGDVLVDEASAHLSRAIVSESTDAAWHVLAFAHAARFSLSVSTSSHRLLAGLQAVLLAAGVPSASPTVPEPSKVEDLDAALNEMSLAVELGDGPEAIALMRGFLAAGGDGDALVSAIVHEAAKEDADATGGHSLVFAHAATQEYRHSASPDRWIHLAALLHWLASLDHRRGVVEQLGAFT